MLNGGVLVLFLFVMAVADAANLGNIGPDFHVAWGTRNIASPDNGRTFELSMDYNSGSAIGSNDRFMFGYISADIRLVPGNSAGILTTFYMKTTDDQNSHHDELDFEFLGNVTGEPYLLQTNIFVGGTGGREVRTSLWFDPTKDYHTYSLLWNSHMIIFYVDSTPIRIYPNNIHLGAPYPEYLPMRLYATIYSGENWVTRGGKVGIDWRYAPFRASFTNFKLQGCDAAMTTGASCAPSQWWNRPQFWQFDQNQMSGLKYVQRTYGDYNYCTDRRRYPTAPPECQNT